MRIIDLDLHFHGVSASGKAIQVSLDGNICEAVWLPVSAIEWEEVRDGEVEVTLPEIMAFDKGLI